MSDQEAGDSRAAAVNLQVTKGVSRDQKRELVASFTESLVSILGKEPEHIHIVIQEVAEEDWGFCGMLTDEWKKARPNA